MRGSGLPRFSFDEVALDKVEFFDSPTDFPRCARSGQANQRHWESHKWGSTIPELGTITLPLRIVPAGKRPRANFGFHKAVRRFVFSIAHFAAPMAPACLPDERHVAGPSVDASVAKRRNNISITRERTGRRGRRQAWQAQAGLCSPIRAVAGETSEPKAAATPANQGRSVRRESQTPAHLPLWTPPLWQVRPRFETVRLHCGKCC